MAKIKSHKSVEQIARKHKLDVSFIEKQLRMGEPIEHEHTKNHDLAMDIALQHLDEIPDYYTRLKKMEASAKKENKRSFKDIKEYFDDVDSAIYPKNSIHLELDKRYCPKCKKLEIRSDCKFGPKYWDIFSVPAKLKEETKKSDNLRKWFTDSKSKDGKPGWVNVVTGGTCASDEPGEGTPKCVSSAKRKSMTKSERLSASRRKKSADPGQQQKSGAAKPTYVKTDVKEGWSDKYKKSIDCDNPEGFSQRSHCQGRKKKMNEETDKKNKGSGKKDACYHKVKSKFDVWPSAYASGALVRCRKVGASNWATKSEETIHKENGEQKLVDKIMDEMKCWPGYEKKGTQKLFGKKYNRCMKSENVSIQDANGNTFAEIIDIIKPEPIKGFKSQIEETTRMQSQTGNVVAVTLLWRGKYYSLKIFFPDVRLPSRKEINDELQKVYPGCRVVHHTVSEFTSGGPLIQTCGFRGGSSANPGPSKNYVKTMGEGVAAWQRKEGKNKSGGLNEPGRKSYEKEHPGSDLKAPSKKVGNPRRASFCARMSGMKKKLTSAKTARDPDSRINKSLRAWNC